MNISETRGAADTGVEAIPNGAGAAAILSAGIGSAMIGILFLAEDASEKINQLLSFYKPVGALSGLTTVAVVCWLVSWFVLHRLWNNQTVAMVKVNTASFALLAVGFLLTFPPFIDLVQGK